MGTLTQRIEQAEKDAAKSGDEIEGLGRVDEREKAIIDRHKSELPGGSLMQKISTGLADMEIEDRRQKRAYAEKPPTALAQMTVDPAREMLANLGDRARVLDVYRKLSPEQRQEWNKLMGKYKAQQIKRGMDKLKLELKDLGEQADSFIEELTK